MEASLEFLEEQSQSDKKNKTAVEGNDFMSWPLTVSFLFSLVQPRNVLLLLDTSDNTTIQQLQILT